jgi:hypothetical protein
MRKLSGSFVNADPAIALHKPLPAGEYIINRMKWGNMKHGRITGLFIILIIGFLLASGCTTSTPSAQPSQTTNHLSIPNLTGTWNVNAQGAVLQKSGIPGAWTHHSGQYSTLTAQAVITDQKDRVLYGIFKAPIGDGESFIAVIGMDNTNVYFADYDGTYEGQIVSNDVINVVYRHVAANDSVVGIGTWTRVK